MTRRTRTYLALGGALAIIAVALVVVRPWQDDEAKEPRQTVWQTITDGIHDGKVPLATALQAMSYVFHLPIPGVQIPAGIDDTDVPSDGTGPLEWVMTHHDELTAAQAAVIDAFFATTAKDIVLHIGVDDVLADQAASPTPTPTTPATSAPATSSTAPPSTPATGASAGLTQTGFLGTGLRPRAFRPRAVTLEDTIRAELIADLAHIGQRLKLPIIKDSWILSDVELIISDADGGNVLMLSEAVFDPVSRKTSPCRVTVYRNSWSNESAGSKLSDTFHVVMTHEAVHCYQKAVALALGVPADSYPTWISEGTALWLAADDTKIAEPILPGLWRKHILGKPERSLLDRSYDSYGLYALLDHLGRDMWGQMVVAWRGALNSGGVSSPQAFLGILGGDEADVHNAWAPWFLRDEGWTEPWVTTGFGLPTDALVARRPIFATRNGSADSLPDRANAIRNVVGSTAEIVRVQTSGTAAAHDSKQNSVLSFTSKTFCVKGDCICPKDSQRPGEHVADLDVSLPLVVAVNAPAGGASFTITARTLEEECGVKSTTTTSTTKPALSKVRCKRTCAMSNGDPHLMTVDGRAYDLQAAGEFVFLRSEDRSLEVQTRQQPYEDSKRVTINTATVALVDGHRVQVDFDASTNSLRARLDGQDVDPTTITEITSTSRLVPYRDGFEIDFPDGTQLWASGLHAYGINVVVNPSDSLRTTSSGIVGTTAGGGANLPKLADGSVLPDGADGSARYHLLYETFTDSWRLTDDISLFTYASGQATADFTIRGFPSEADLVPLDQLSPDQLAIGEAACAEIVDATLHSQCVFDAAITGQAGFGDLYRSTQQVIGAETLPETVPPAPPATNQGDPVVMPLDAYRSIDGQALAEDGTLYLSVERVDGTFGLVAIDAATASVEAERDLAGGGTVVIAAGSVWVEGASGLGTCAIGRFDSSTLASQATIATSFSTFFIGTRVAATAEAAWWIDASGGTADGRGVLLRRIDPATNESEAGVELPSGTADVFGSASTLFAITLANDVQRLSAGKSAFEDLGAHEGPLFIAGSGIWQASAINGPAQRFDSTGGTASRTIDTRGLLTAADDEAVYVEHLSDANTLWRVPVDGSAETLVGTPAIMAVGDRAVHLSYSDGPLRPLVAGGKLVKIWFVPRPDGSGFNFYIQTITP